MPLTTTGAIPLDERPADEELDLFGLTHRGKVRTENQDQFLLCTVHPEVVLRSTSIPDPQALAIRGQRLATIMLVADGVGGTAGGSTASRLATEAVIRYVASSLRRYHGTEASSEDEFTAALRAAAIAAHDAVRIEAESRPDERQMATTLSLGIVMWPWLYVVQVGDSRCYVYADGTLRQITRDQTLAQDLVDRGILAKERAHASPLSHVLSSAIGAPEATPEVTRVDIRERGSVVLVCSDGLTKHVTDAEIAEHLGRMRNAEQVARELLQLALERGGTDNITMVIGRALKKGSA
jgi:serine/threonine protein phosphatase PrpC